MVIIDPPTGQILAMVGSRDYNREDIHGEVNNAIALNSPGSTLKPFTYATAFEQGWGPEWPIVDSSITYKEPDGKTFIPRNPDGRTRGVVPLKQALGNSFNIPAFKTILWVGVDNMVATAKSMGITTLDRQLGPAVTLGGVDVKLLDMVYGYSTFANNGVMVGEPTTLEPAGRQPEARPGLHPADQEPQREGARQQRRPAARVRDEARVRVHDHGRALERREPADHVRPRQQPQHPRLARRDKDGHERAVREQQAHRRHMDVRVHA